MLRAVDLTLARGTRKLLDGANLTETFIVSRVTNGQGAMPAFGGQLTDKEIADLAYYIAHVQKKAG